MAGYPGLCRSHPSLLVACGRGGHCCNCSTCRRGSTQAMPYQYMLNTMPQITENRSKQLRLLPLSSYAMQYHVL